MITAAGRAWTEPEIIEAIAKAIALVERIDADNNQHGGLLTKATTRANDDLRVALIKLVGNES